MTCLRATRAQTGFGLIEVMVAVLVLSLAFLSLAALAARSLAGNNSAMSRSMATVALYAITDALRADRASATSGAYNTGDDPITADNCPTDTDSLAARQLNQWCTQQLAAPALDGAAPTTTGAINCATTGVCTITITWLDSRGGAGSQRVTTTGML
jgi:type IV pilus assembly protein PilV